MLLPAAEFAYNSALSEDLGSSPFEICLGWKPRDPLKLLSGFAPPVQATKDFLAKQHGAFQDAQYAHQVAKEKQTSDCAALYKTPTYVVA